MIMFFMTPSLGSHNQLYHLEKVNQAYEPSSFQFELMDHLSSTRQHAR